MRVYNCLGLSDATTKAQVVPFMKWKLTKLLALKTRCTREIWSVETNSALKRVNRRFLLLSKLIEMSRIQKDLVIFAKDVKLICSLYLSNNKFYLLNVFFTNAYPLLMVKTMFFFRNLSKNRKFRCLIWMRYFQNF